MRSKVTGSYQQKHLSKHKIKKEWHGHLSRLEGKERNATYGGHLACHGHLSICTFHFSLTHTVYSFLHFPRLQRGLTPEVLSGPLLRLQDGPCQGRQMGRRVQRSVEWARKGAYTRGSKGWRRWWPKLLLIGSAGGQVSKGRWSTVAFELISRSATVLWYTIAYLWITINVKKSHRSVTGLSD